MCKQKFRMPAEWARHAATWLSWPHNVETWPGLLKETEQAMVDIVVALAPHEHVHINVLGREHAEHVMSLLGNRVPSGSVSVHSIPTNDAWIRDHGAIFVTDVQTGLRTALDFRYNAWGEKYPPYDDDQLVADAMAAVTGDERIEMDWVLEGGSIDVNGSGALLTTTQCLLNPNRNPQLSRSEIELRLSVAFGVDSIIWLGDGIQGDDTDGHIDDITRFVAPKHIVTASEENHLDPNYTPLQQNIDVLRDLRIDESSIELTILPMPDPMYSQGQRLPASYSNFYIANDVVLLPVFGCDRDDQARSVLQACFTDRAVVPIDSRALVHGLGAIHCLTQQLPEVE